MTTLNIKDPEVYRLASVLAGRWETTRTGAVRRALSDAVATSGLAREEKKARIGALLDEIAGYAIPGADPAAVAGDLYDEDGLPR